MRVCIMLPLVPSILRTYRPDIVLVLYVPCICNGRIIHSIEIVCFNLSLSKKKIHVLNALEIKFCNIQNNIQVVGGL